MLFKVAAVSSNTNAFGLYNHVLIARSGQAWQVLANALNKRQQGETLNIDPSRLSVDSDIKELLAWPGEPRSFAGCSFECPTQLFPEAPPELVRQVWNLPEPTRLDEGEPTNA